MKALLTRLFDILDSYLHPFDETRQFLLEELEVLMDERMDFVYEVEQHYGIEPDAAGYVCFPF